MRLKEIHIEGFGRFNDYSRSEIPPGFSVIQGNNEAGKSTLLAFLRAILFGFPAQRSAKNCYPPLRGGRHGGRIHLTRKVDGNEQRYIVERIAGKGSGTVCVILPDGTEGGEPAFQQLVGNASRDLFENVFAFSLSELQSLNASLDRDGVRDRIYAAGLGMNPATIRKARQELENKKSELFAPGGRGQQRINGAVQSLETLRKKIEERKSDPQSHVDRQTKWALSDETLKSAEAEHEETRRRSERVQLLLQSRGEWLSLEEKRHELAQMPVIDVFPENGLHRLDAIVNERRLLADQLLGPVGEKSALEAKLLDLSPDKHVLLAESVISQLELERASFDRDCLQFPVLDEECRRQVAQLADHLRELDASWDELRLLAFQTSIALNDEIRRFQEVFKTSGENVAQLQTQVESANGEHANALAVEQRKKSALDHCAPPSQPLDEKGIQDLSQRLQHYKEAARDRPGLLAELKIAEGSMADELRSIGPDWDEKRLLTFDTSLSACEKIRKNQKALNDAEHERQEAECDRQRKAEDCAATEILHEEARRVFNAAPEPPLKNVALLKEQRRAMRALRDCVIQRQEQRSSELNLTERQQEIGKQLKRRGQEPLPLLMPAWGVFALATIALFALIMLAFAVNWTIGIVAFAVFAALAAGYAAMRNASKRNRTRATEAQATDCGELRVRLAQIDAQLAACQKRLVELDTECAEQAREAQLPPDSQIDAVNRAEEESERIQEALQSWDALRTAAEEKAREADRAGQGVTAADARIFEATARETTAKSAWQQWLQSAELNAAVSPSGVLELTARICTLREKLKIANTLNGRIIAIDETIHTYEMDATNVLERCGRKPVARGGLSDAIRDLVEALKTQKVEELSREQAMREWKNAVEFSSEQRNKSEVAESKRQACEDALAEQKKLWLGVLRRAGLYESLSPEGAKEFVAGVSNLRAELKVMKDKCGQRDAARASIENYAGCVSKICEALGAPQPQPHQAGMVAQGLAARLSAAKGADADQTRTCNRASELDLMIKEMNGKLESRDTEIKGLLSAGNADSEEAFRASATCFEKRQKLKGDIQACEAHLRQWAGGEGEAALLRQELAASTLQLLEDERAYLAASISGVKEKIKLHTEERACLGFELEQLEKSCDASSLQMEDRAERAVIQNSAGEWSALRLAEFLLDRAREKYERERRPAVIQEAERFFKQLTGGKYCDLVAPIGGTDIQVRDCENKRLKIEELSRGTAEQLYLALRFGCVQEYKKNSEPLPLIFDDILVNFDAARATAAIAAMHELGKEHQILLFTCHSDTIARVRRFNPEIITGTL